MNKREWVQALLEGRKDIPVAQQWMSFFNADLARRLTPSDCHYDKMWLYDVGRRYDFEPTGRESLEAMIRFNNYTGRCMTNLGKGANLSFGHGGPGEFFCRLIKRAENELIVEYETGVQTQIRFEPHFFHNFNHPVTCRSDLEHLSLPDPNDPQRYRGFAHDAQYLKHKGEYVLASLNGFFSGIHYFLMDYEKTLTALVTEENFIQALLDRLGQWNLTAAARMIDTGADCIVLCDDLGSKNSLMFSAELYRKFFKPWHQKLCRRIHEMGGKVHLHSHGAITPLLNDLAQCGFDFINPFDPEEGFDIEQIVEQYSSQFVVVGGFPTSFWYWRPSQQESYLQKMAALARRCGRFIFMDSGGVPEDVNRQDFERIIRISRKVRQIDNCPGAV